MEDNEIVEVSPRHVSLKSEEKLPKSKDDGYELRKTLKNHLRRSVRTISREEPKHKTPMGEKTKEKPKSDPPPKLLRKRSQSLTPTSVNKMLEDLEEMELRTSCKVGVSFSSTTLVKTEESASKYDHLNYAQQMELRNIMGDRKEPVRRVKSEPFADESSAVKDDTQVRKTRTEEEKMTSDEEQGHFNLDLHSRSELSQCLVECLNQLNQLSTMTTILPKHNLVDFEYQQRVMKSSVMELLRYEYQLLQKVKELNSTLDYSIKKMEYSVIETGVKRGQLSRHERRQFTRINNDIYTSFDNIYQTTKGTVDSYLHCQREESVVPVKSKKLRLFWETKFSEYGTRVPWKVFKNEITPESQTSGTSKQLKYLLDPWDTDYITLSVFSRFLTIFGPIPEIHAKVKSYFEKSWAQGFMDEATSHKFLLAEPELTFLIRFDNGRVDRPYLEVKNGKFESTALCADRLNWTENGNKLNFTSLMEFGDYLEHTLKWKPIVNHLREKPYFSDYITSEVQATKLMSISVPGSFVMFLSTDQTKSFLTVTYMTNFGVRSKHLERIPEGYEVVDVNEKPKKNRVKKNRKSFAPEKNEGSDEGKLEETDLTVTDKKKKRKIFETINHFLKAHPYMKFNFSPAGIPSVSFVPFIGKRSGCVHGPQHKSTPYFVNSEEMGMYCETEVTYPKRSLGSMVLCDAFRAARVGNRITTVICDGCSWGPRSHEASQKASKTFCDYMSSETLHEKTDTSDALMVHLQNALFAAHKSIAHDKAGNNVFQAGTTTLCGGVLAKLDSEVDEWAFVCISVGDSKAFHWSAANRKVKDITWGNRFDARDPSDCGGRIGPYSPQGEPDLRNLRFYFAACNKDDLIMVVTDGIYDNLDPEHLGMDPRSVSKEYDYDSWDDMPNILVKQAKEDYVVAQIEKFIESSETKSPQEITKKLILNSFMVTERSRTYMENHPNEAEPKSYKAFPGKMDHVTCITIKIKSLEEVEVDADEQLKNLRQRLSHPKQKRIGSGIFKKTLYRSPNKKKEELEGMEFKYLSPSAPIHKKFIEYLRKRLAFEQYQLYEDILDFETCECDGKEMEEKAKLLFEKCTIYAGNPSLIQELKDRIGKSNFSLEMFLPIKTETLQILESMFLEFKISKSKK